MNCAHCDLKAEPLIETFEITESHHYVAQAGILATDHETRLYAYRCAAGHRTYTEIETIEAHLVIK